MGLTLQDLKSQLWNSAEILRGSAVDRTDWKAYILPLVFFKRISDVWDEETAEAAELYGDVDPVDFPEVHRFVIPAGCHWRNVRETPANVGAALSHAMRELELANPERLYRVFGTADWGNRAMLTDETLKDLIEGFSQVPLGNSVVSSDILGDAYEYLVGKFADVTRRKKAGEFYTPRSVVRMMVELLDPKEGETIDCSTTQRPRDCKTRSRHLDRSPLPPGRVGPRSRRVTMARSRTRTANSARQAKAS